jgi:hypothetical protein
MSLRGVLSTMPAEDVLDWVARKKLAAPITFERRGVTRSLVVEDGHVVWASSNRREEQLGVILVASGLVAERALADALEARTETGVPLGKVLLMSGLVKESDLVQILVTKIRETLGDVLTWTDGTFDLVPRNLPPSTGVPARLSIDAGMIVARRRVARATEIAVVLGGDDCTFYAPPDASPPLAISGDAIDSVKLWGMAGDRKSAGDMAAAFSGERFLVHDRLADMVAAGQLVVDRRIRERTNSALELAAGARGRLREGDRAGALHMAQQALQQDPSDAEVRKTFAQCERARVAEVAKHLLARHRVPRRVRDPSRELTLSEAELELAQRVDGRWDILSLVRSAPVREAEAMLAFAHLAELGVIELG